MCAGYVTGLVDSFFRWDGHSQECSDKGTSP
jgi:hypothetical protein